MDDFGEIIAPYLPNLRVPQSTDRVYKDECCLSYDTPTSNDGLYVCLNTFLGFGKKYVDLYHKCTGNAVFLHIKDVTSTEATPAKVRATEAEPTRLAIGVEGGFKTDKDVKKVYKNSIVILPDYIEISIDQIEVIPALVLRIAEAVMNAESATKKEEILEWDGEIKQVSKHAASLLQIDNGVKLPPSGWKCSRCDLTENLWANLSDGTILCGRKYFDGSGGNGHALEYFKETQLPLVVKLGTINAQGADVYSYDEDDMVDDPFLEKHLRHFGIDMQKMQKSDKTMTELEIDLNKKIGNEWELIQESGAKLNPAYGRGLTGMKNLGNSCYLNSTMQVFFSIPEIQNAYLRNMEETFKNHIGNPVNDFNVQMTKLASGLLSGDYSPPVGAEAKDENFEYHGVSPIAFKRLIGKGHAEFSSNRQQDAQEFILHLFQLMEKNNRVLGTNCENNLKFNVEERIECIESKMVKYTTKPDFMVALPVPYDMAENLNEVHVYEQKKEAAKADKSNEEIKVVRAKIPFSACLKCLFEDEIIPDFWSPALKEKSTARKRMRFGTFPNYLIFHLQKFTVGHDWVPKKLDVSVDMPDTVNLNDYRGQGLQANEKEFPDEEPPSGETGDAQQYNIDQATVSQLVEMGFPLEACRKAVHLTGNCGAEMAMSWLMEHISDPDFSDPLPPLLPQGASSAPKSAVNEEGISMIMSMGFTKTQAMKALKATDNNLERAADWIFSHIDEVDSIPLGEGDTGPTWDSSGGTSSIPDGNGNYELFAFISHMGTSTSCGHYVCHIKKNGQWIIFNDEKVAQSVTPPKDLGYLYFYRRL